MKLGTEGVAQMVEHLLCKCESLSLNTHPTKEKKKKKRGLVEWLKW
jgi:hypothetical protein